MLRRIRVVEMPLRGINERHVGVKMTRFGFRFQILYKESEITNEKFVLENAKFL